jgi:hypothetical protein
MVYLELDAIASARRFAVNPDRSSRVNFGVPFVSLPVADESSS